MPKIIKNVEDTIRNCATELFVEFGYTNVDMKMISKKSEIAVGTLYNYYENKKELYLSILKESWQITLNKLNDINESTISFGEKLRKIIGTLYEDIEARKGLGKSLINTSISELKDDKEVNDLISSLILKVENFFNHTNKVEMLDKCSDINTKLAESLIISTVTMLEFHPHNKEDNIKFLFNFVSLALKQKQQGEI